MEKHETPQDRYHKAHTVSLTIRLMKNTEQDIMQKLDNVSNKAGYIKALIRADLAKEAGLDSSAPILNWIGGISDKILTMEKAVIRSVCVHQKIQKIKDRLFTGISPEQEGLMDQLVKKPLTA